MRFEVDYSICEIVRLFNIKKYVIIGFKFVCLSILVKIGKITKVFYLEFDIFIIW